MTVRVCYPQILFIHRGYGSRRVLNQQQVLELCNSWQPATGEFKRARCRLIEFRDGEFLDDMETLQSTHILVRICSSACTVQVYVLLPYAP